MSFATYAAWNVRHECGKRFETFIYGNYYVYTYTYLCTSIIYLYIFSHNIELECLSSCINGVFSTFFQFFFFNARKKSMFSLLLISILASPWLLLSLSLISSILNSTYLEDDYFNIHFMILCRYLNGHLIRVSI